MRMKAVYMGTPEIAATILETLLSSEIDVIGVVTQPDKPKGRGKEMASSPVKEVALKHQIPLYQPRRVKDAVFIELMRGLAPDIILVAAFGQMLSKELLELPQYGCINVHASLLPKYRGSAPIQWVILNGETKTGVTIMKMDVGCDTGDMILSKEVEISKEETGGSLHDKLAQIGGVALLEAIEQIKDGTVQYRKQNEADSSYIKMLSKEMGLVDFNQDAVTIERMIRGLNPWPSAYTYYKGKTLKLWSAEVISDASLVEESKNMENGSILKVTKDTIYVKTGAEILKIKELQLEGKKRMLTGEFLRGYQMQVGELLGKKA